MIVYCIVLFFYLFTSLFCYDDITSVNACIPSTSMLCYVKHQFTFYMSWHGMSMMFAVSGSDFSYIKGGKQVAYDYGLRIARVFPVLLGLIYDLRHTWIRASGFKSNEHLCYLCRSEKSDIVNRVLRFCHPGHYQSFDWNRCQIRPLFVILKSFSYCYFHFFLIDRRLNSFFKWKTGISLGDISNRQSFSLYQKIPRWDVIF